MKELTIQAFYRAIQLALFYVAALVVALIVDVASGHAQPPVAPPSSTPVNEGQDDQEWLTSYMMAHEGYRLHHAEALNDTFSKMTPSQLGTMRDMYEQKHQQMVQQQQLFNRMNALQVSMAEQQNARAQRAMDQFSQEQSRSAEQEQQRLNQMHTEAAEISAQRSLSYPSYMQPLGYPYPYGYGRPNLYHPYGYPY